jgi:hypothetical protein
MAGANVVVSLIWVEYICRLQTQVLPRPVLAYGQLTSAKVLFLAVCRSMTSIEQSALTS